jgi:hypothetical protein
MARFTAETAAAFGRRGGLGNRRSLATEEVEARLDAAEAEAKEAKVRGWADG